MPDFDPDAPVIVEKTSDIGKMRKHYFNEGEFSSIEEVYEYLQDVSVGTFDSGTYEIRQPVGTVKIEQDETVSYTANETATLESVIQAINSHSAVTTVEKLTDAVFEWQVTRPPYELGVTGFDVDISVTVDSEPYEFDTVEEELLSQLSLGETVFFEGKLEKYSRGDRHPSEYKLFFTIERDLENISNSRHLYQQVRQEIDNEAEVGEVVLAEQIRVGTTHSYVRGEPYPDTAILIDVEDLTDETSFMDDVVFTKDKTETEAFNEVRPTLESHTKTSKKLYSKHLSEFIDTLPYEVEVIGAGEYSSGTENRLVLGLTPIA